jgi:D-alanyl-D-alanine carboxypeptidase/D-alanyl-D-alanine-endopeptidase (penicillin-binding protein 4)
MSSLRVPRLLLPLIAGTLSWLAVSLLAAPWAASAQTRDEAIEAALSVRALRGARIGALVVDEQGHELFARAPDEALIPASNHKLLTSLAALSVLGPTHRFTTELLADAAPSAEGVVHTLYLRGSGDPALTSEDFWRMADDLRATGVSRVTGDLVLDDSAFDGRRWHPSWGRTGSRAYHAPVGALTVNYGAFAVTVEPGAEQGDALRVVVDPPIPYLALSLRGRTGPARSRSTLVVDRQSGAPGERVIVAGAMPAGQPAKTFQRSVLDPARYAGAVLRLQLESLGIEIAGGVRLGYVPIDAVPLLAFEGSPLSDVVRRFMKYSNNQMGEALLKTLGARATGRPGSWESGAAAVRAQLEALDLPVAGLVLRDGSGLSYENRVSPRLLVATLRAGARDFRIAPEFQAALPLAGADGTLSDRAEGALGRVRAKTGLLTRVTALSGYALAQDGERLTFSILVNGFRGSAQAAMDALDRFAEALVGPAGKASPAPDQERGP